MGLRCIVSDAVTWSTRCRDACVYCARGSVGMQSPAGLPRTCGVIWEALTTAALASSRHFSQVNSNNRGFYVRSSRLRDRDSQVVFYFHYRQQRLSGIAFKSIRIFAKSASNLLLSCAKACSRGSSVFRCAADLHVRREAYTVCSEVVCVCRRGRGRGRAHYDSAHEHSSSRGDAAGPVSTHARGDADASLRTEVSAPAARNAGASAAMGFDQAEAEALLKQRYAEAMQDPLLKEHTEKPVSAWGGKVCAKQMLKNASRHSLRSLNVVLVHGAADVLIGTWHSAAAIPSSLITCIQR